MLNQEVNHVEDTTDDYDVEDEAPTRDTSVRCDTACESSES
jgi:hypothetical protein